MTAGVRTRSSRLLAVAFLAAVVAACQGPVTPTTQDPDRRTTAPDPFTLSPAPTPRPPAPDIEPAADGIRIEVGDDIQVAVDAAPPGSTFHLAGGVHREQVVVPRDGDRFVGEPGAVLNGSRVLAPEDFVRDGDRWWIGGQDQDGLVRGQVRDGIPESVRNAEEVFVDGGRRLLPADFLRDLEPGRFHFDYDADRIWLADDPASFDLIETSVAPFAFGGTGVRDVVIEDLVVEKYASPVQFGAIGGSLGFQFPYDWTVRHVEARLNHGGGIGIGPGMLIEHVDVHDNGQIGIIGDGIDQTDGEDGGYTAPIVVRNSRIHANNVLGFDDKHEAGATKFKDTRSGITFENNWVHDNDGPGPWFDDDNADATIVRNLVEDNVGTGIFYEISFGQTLIADNVVRRNGVEVERLEPGIFVSNSSDVEVRGNVVVGGAFGIVVISRGNREPQARDVLVADNDIQVGAGWSGALLLRGETPDLLGTIRFEGNRYVVEDPEHEAFRWGSEELELAAWTDRVETTAEVVDEAAFAAFTETSRGFRFAAYGPTWVGSAR